MAALGLMSNYDERVEAITERTAASMYAFWSAMLTAHTVILSVAVALPSVVSSVSAWQFKLVAVVATFCMAAILFNFASVRMQYEAIGKRLLDLEAELSDQQKEKDIAKANTRRIAMRLFELAAAIGLVVDAVFLSWALLA